MSPALLTCYPDMTYNLGSVMYEGLTSGDLSPEDYDPEDDDNLEEDDDEGLYPIMTPMTGYDLYVLTKHAPAAPPGVFVISDNDAGYAANSYFARAMIRE